MRTLIIFILFIASSLIAYSQKGKARTEAMILHKVRALPEVKEWFATAKKSKPALLLNEPDKDSKYYSVQVGISNMDMFRTAYYLYIDPKKLKIYFWDQLDTANSNITLQQWRYWRTKPGWKEMHYYKGGKMILLAK
jgi:hypothetical protein